MENRFFILSIFLWTTIFIDSSDANFLNLFQNHSKNRNGSEANSMDPSAIITPSPVITTPSSILESDNEIDNNISMESTSSIPSATQNHSSDSSSESSETEENNENENRRKRPRRGAADRSNSHSDSSIDTDHNHQKRDVHNSDENLENETRTQIFTETDTDDSNCDENQTEFAENENQLDNEIVIIDDADQSHTDLIKTLHDWENAVENYLQSQSNHMRRRRRRQSQWSQLFPSQLAGTQSQSGTVAGSANAKNSNSMSSFGSNAIGEALQPAMSLMNQGVSILSNIYSSQMKRSGSILLGGENETDENDQFRAQLQQLQGRLNDVGQQMQRVFGTFQNLQLPFFNNLLGNGDGGLNLGSMRTDKESKHRIY